MTVDHYGLDALATRDGGGFAAALRRARAGAQLSQGELAERAGVSERTVRNLESGRCRPRGSTVRLLAAALERSSASRSAEDEAEDPEPGPSPAAHVVTPWQLPHVTRAFVGRRTILRRLDSLLAARNTSLLVVTGAPGVGKSALAVHWAAGVRDRFPDGQLYLDLHGCDDDRPPLSLDEALTLLLDGLGVPASSLPALADQRVGLLRSLITSRRIMLVLDNAASSQQVGPLLVPGDGTVLVVTSRNALLDVIARTGASSITVPALTEDESLLFLAERLGRGRVHDGRAAASRIARACGGIPLALAAVAARGAAHPRFPLASLAAELDTIASTNPVPVVRAAFAHSYRTVPADAAKVFRSLGHHPGTDSDVVSSAALSGLAIRDTAAALHALAEAHLVEERAPGRFRVDGAARSYAVDLAREDPPAARREAVQRLYAHYTVSALSAALTLDPHGGATRMARPGVVPVLPASAEALRWFADEWPNTVQATIHAGADGAHSDCWRLAHATADYLRRSGRWEALASIQRTALEAAVRAGDTSARVTAHRHLADVALHHRRPATAWQHLRAALSLCRADGDAGLEAAVRLAAANLHMADREVPHALNQAMRARALCRRDNDPVGAARALNAIGWDLHQLGSDDIAVTLGHDAVRVLEDHDDRPAAGASWDSLGHAQNGLGDHREAAASFSRALDHFDAVGATSHGAEALDGLALSHALAGRPRQARDARHRAEHLRSRLET